jgi:hypothetical protein
MREWVIEIPYWHPIRINDLLSMHWGERIKVKKCQHYLIAVEAWAARIPIAEGVKRRVTLTIVLGPRQKGGDPDAYWKVLLDSLVKCKVLVNDSKEYVDLAPVQYQRAENEATIILIEDLGPAGKT